MRERAPEAFIISRAFLIHLTVARAREKASAFSRSAPRTRATGSSVPRVLFRGRTSGPLSPALVVHPLRFCPACFRAYTYLLGHATQYAHEETLEERALSPAVEPDGRLLSSVHLDPLFASLLRPAARNRSFYRLRPLILHFLISVC